MSPSTRSAASPSPTWSRAPGLSPAAQPPRRDRGRDLLPQASLLFGTLHLARARPLQGLHLVGGGGPQPGAARPPQTSVASPAAAGDSGAGQSARPPLLAIRFPRPAPLLQHANAPAPAGTTPPPALLHH